MRTNTPKILNQLRNTSRLLPPLAPREAMQALFAVLMWFVASASGQLSQKTWENAREARLGMEAIVRSREWLFLFCALSPLSIARSDLPRLPSHIRRP